MRKKLAVFIAGVLALLLLSACGDMESDFSLSYKEYKGKANADGEMLAFYNADVEEYEQFRLPEEYRAETPEEVRGEVTSRRDVEGHGFFLTLRDKRDGTLVAEETVVAKTIADKQIVAWIREKWKARLDTIAIGEAYETRTYRGDKVAAYDRDSGIYSYDAAFIPEDLRASSPEEIGLIADYSLGSEELVGVYGEPAGTVTGTGELLSLRMVTADGLMASDTFYCGSPEAVTPDSSGAFTFAQTLDYSEIGEWVRQQQQYCLDARGFCGQEELMGGGDKLLGRGEDDADASGTYTFLHVPEEYRAARAEEVALIVVTSRSFFELEDGGDEGAPVRESERVSVKMLYPQTGEIFYEGHIDAHERLTFAGNVYRIRVPELAVEDLIREKFGLYLYHLHVRSLIEEGRIGSGKAAVLNENSGLYVPVGDVTVGEDDDSVGAVLHITGSYDTKTASFASQSSGVIILNFQLQKLRLELKNPANGKTLRSAWLTAGIPESLELGPDPSAPIIVDIPDSDIADWLRDNWAG